jgi:hypothetical protein
MSTMLEKKYSFSVLEKKERDNCLPSTDFDEVPRSL